MEHVKLTSLIEEVKNHLQKKHECAVSDNFVSEQAIDITPNNTQKHITIVFHLQNKNIERLLIVCEADYNIKSINLYFDPKFKLSKFYGLVLQKD